MANNYSIPTDLTTVLADIATLDILHRGIMAPNIVDILNFATTASTTLAQIRATELTNLAASLVTIDGLHDVPAQNAVTNAHMRDVIGNKTDALVEAVGVNKSIQGYLKGLTQELSQRKVPRGIISSHAAVVLTDVVNINDKGFLTGIAVTCPGGSSAHIKVTIDGTVVITDANVFITAGAEISWQSLSFNHRFNTSLLVQDKLIGGGIINTAVTYTID